ncbi:uncharacterized protein LOC117825987 isoform X1 [Notolabrus celidotus]|nr:uncharacterized protein LOC117825987 isoform X1 [Notolabrus celidotus]
MIISAGQCSGLPEFYKLLNIVINFEKVFFVTAKLSSWFMEHYRSYEVIDTSCVDVEILDPEDLNPEDLPAPNCIPSCWKVDGNPKGVSTALNVMALLLRVNINPKLIRKVQLTKRPESVEQLHDELREKLELEGDFSLQYEDPDFENALCNLIDIVELPAEKAVLHIVWNSDDKSPSQASISSLDTASISSPSSSHSTSSIVQTILRSASEWPSPFPVPSFAYDVELKLRKGNETFQKTGKGLSLTRDAKMEILDKLAQEMFALKAYPDKSQIESVASELICKHPCLTEPGSGTGYDGWTTSIKYKLGNYRAKLRQAGCHEVSVNRRRGRSEDPDKGGFSLKKPKRGEVNHLPDHPENFDDDTLEDERCVLVDETKKKQKDMELISQKMELTFSLRRKEIIEVQPMVMEIQERWPALFLEEQICREFYRVTTKDLLGSFRAAIDTYCPRLLKLYRARKAAFGQDMESLLDVLDEQTSDITMHRSRACLEGLPLFLRDTSEKLFLKCLDTDPKDRQTKGVQMGVLTVFVDDGAPASLQTVNSIAVVLEETIVLEDIPDLPTALAYLFGLLYALNIEFPRDLRYTFEAVQHIFMELTPSCSQRVRSLKTKLLL